MILRRYASVEGEIENSRLVLTGPRIYKTRHGDVEIFVCGKGAKDAGFKPQSWVIRCEGEWYIRPTGAKKLRTDFSQPRGPNGWPMKLKNSRGQYLIRGGCWTTEVYRASPMEVNELEMAEIIS